MPTPAAAQSPKLASCGPTRRHRQKEFVFVIAFVFVFDMANAASTGRGWAAR
jgi:hypothetical protein